MKSFAFIFIEDTKQGIPCINIRCLSDIFSSPISYSSDYYINNGRTNFPLETLISPTNEMLLKHRSILFIISDGNAISLCSFYLFLFSIQKFLLSLPISIPMMMLMLDQCRRGCFHFNIFAFPVVHCSSTRKSRLRSLRHPKCKRFQRKSSGILLACSIQSNQIN